MPRKGGKGSYESDARQQKMMLRVKDVKPRSLSQYMGREGVQKGE